VGPALAQATVVRAVLCLAVLALPGCFYLDDINVAPQAVILQVSTEPVHIDKRVQFSAAQSSDEDGDELSFDWQASTCVACAAYASDVQTNFDVPVVGHQPIRVRLKVFDIHGAASEATLEVPVINRSPELVTQVSTQPNPDGTYTVTRPIEFAAEGADEDGDPLVYSFTLHPPPQSNPDAVTFEKLSETAYRLVPDVPGQWEVEIAADDKFGGVTTIREQVTVAADEPPCLAATSPLWAPENRIILLRSGGPRRFAVESVIDDLDPYPGSGIHFRWLVAGPGMTVPAEIAGRDLPDLLIDPGELDAGDVLGVRVEIRDRNPRPLPCGADQAACSITGDTCLQRVTWTVEVR
jgi:hypothetical protein